MARRKKGRRKVAASHQNADDLVARLRQRQEGAFFLDLRTARWGHEGRVQVRDPEHHKWPAKGRDPMDAREAERWVREFYHPYLLQKLAPSGEAPDGITVKEASDRYLPALLERLDDRKTTHNTYRNRRAQLGTPLAPLHDEPLKTLTNRAVVEWLRGVRSKKRVDGRTVSVEPVLSYRTNLLTSLVAVYRHTFPQLDCPFSEAGLAFGASQRAWKDKLLAGKALDISCLGEKVYEKDEVKRLLVAAFHYDQEAIGNSPPLRVRTRQISAEAIALMGGTGARLDEVRRIQWHDIHEGSPGKPDWLYIRGMKTERALRAQPIQDGLKPWIEWIRERCAQELGRPPRPTDFLIQNNPRGYSSRPVSRALGERVAKVQVVAGLKREQRAAHIFRATFITQVGNAKHPKSNRRLVPDERLAEYVGHAIGPKLTVRPEYIQQLVSTMTLAHARALDWFPTPEEVLAELASFVPTAPAKRGAGAK